MKNAMSTSVSQRLEIYGVASDVGRPRGRILSWAAGLHEALVAARASEDAVDYMMGNDTRRYLFMLEGLLRLYRQRYGKVIDKQLIATKAFEDQLGAVDYAICMRAHGAELDLPKKTRKWLAKQLDRARRDTLELVEKRWLPDEDGESPGLAKLLRKLLAVEWDDYEADKTYLRGELARRLRKVHEANYDMADLEEGIHELRRQLRWLPIYLTALDGFAELAAELSPVPEYEPLLSDSLVSSPFAQLTASEAETGPVPLSQSLYVANTKMIAELGDLKDELQLVHGMAAALAQSGEAKSRKKAKKKALKLLGKTSADEERIYERCAEIYSEIKRTGLAGHFADQLAPPAKDS